MLLISGIMYNKKVTFIAQYWLVPGFECDEPKSNGVVVMNPKRYNSCLLNTYKIRRLHNCVQNATRQWCNTVLLDI